MLAVPENHPLAQREALTLGELSDQRLLLLEDGHCLREQALDVCRLSGAHEKTEFRATSLETLRQMVAANVGVTLLPTLAVKPPVARSDNIHLLRFADSHPSRSIAMCWRRSSAMAGFLTRLAQVFGNLLGNSSKYTPRGGSLTVEASEAALEELPDEVRDAVSQERRYTQVTVRDTGVGIAPEDLPHIFDRFYRTENPLKIEAGGTGLGLSLVKPLVELLGGRIWVTSEPGAGSTFSFILPAAIDGR